jgi:hypothetical protein
MRYRRAAAFNVTMWRLWSGDSTYSTRPLVRCCKATSCIWNKNRQRHPSRKIEYLDYDARSTRASTSVDLAPNPGISSVSTRSHPHTNAGCPCHRDLTVMLSLRASRDRSSLNQQTVNAHHPFRVNRSSAPTFSRLSQYAPDVPIAVAWQVVDDQPNFFDQTGIVRFPDRSPFRQTVGRASLAATFERATPRTSQTCFTGRPTTMASAQSSYWELGAHIPSWPCRQKRLTRERPDTLSLVLQP